MAKTRYDNINTCCRQTRGLPRHVILLLKRNGVPACLTTMHFIMIRPGNTNPGPVLIRMAIHFKTRLLPLPGSIHMIQPAPQSISPIIQPSYTLAAGLLITVPTHGKTGVPLSGGPSMIARAGAFTLGLMQILIKSSMQMNWKFTG